jgi:FkbH-like protein
LSASPRHRIYVLEVRDKFGDYGLTGVVIIEIGGADWQIDTLLLSCRVLGRGVEKALLALIAEEARKESAQTITASFRPTAKNGPASDFLAQQGFSPSGENKWRIAIAEIPPLEASIARL